MFLRWLTTAQRLARPGVGLIMLAWPFLIWAGLHYDLLTWMLPCMVVLLLLRLLIPRQYPDPLRLATLGIAFTALALCLGSIFLRQYQLLLYYPVLVNLVLLGWFAGSLLTPMSLIERIARLQHPDLPAKGIHYTRKVTGVWCGFFILNGSISLYTCLADDLRNWALWNGMLSYGLMGLLMAVEWWVRQSVIKRY